MTVTKYELVKKVIELGVNGKVAKKIVGALAKKKLVEELSAWVG